MANQKNKKQTKLVTTPVSETNEFKRFVLIIAIIAIIAFAFYFLAVIVSKKNNALKYQNTSTKAQIEYDELIIGEMFQKGGEYYTLLLKKDNDFEALYNNYIKSYKKLEGSMMVYKIDLASAFNKKYISDTTNLDTNDFKVSDNCLLKIKDGQIMESYIGNDAIINQFYQMTKTKNS